MNLSPSLSMLLDTSNTMSVSKSSLCTMLGRERLVFLVFSSCSMSLITSLVSCVSVLSPILSERHQSGVTLGWEGEIETRAEISTNQR